MRSDLKTDLKGLAVMSALLLAAALLRAAAVFPNL